MTEGPDAAPAVEACLDMMVGDRLMGWARHAARPDEVVLLQLSLGPRRLSVHRADVIRPDLAEAWGSPGRHGFAIPVPAAVMAEARATGHPITVAALADPGRVLFSIDNHEALALPPVLAAVMADRLAGLDGDRPAPPVRTPEGSAATAALLAPTRPRSDGLPPLFAYAAHVGQMRQGAPTLAPDLIAADLQHHLRWYIDDYGAARAPLRAPLSADVIAWLNEPLVMGGLPFAATRVMLWHMATDGGPHGLASLADPDAYRRLLYWWAAERAPALGVEDCLVSPLHVGHLRQVPEHWARQAFPLSRFMEEALAARPLLALLGPPHALSARVTAYLVLALDALDAPGLLRFVPAAVIDRLFNGSAPLFDTLAQALVGAAHAPGAARAPGAAAYRARLLEAGFDLDRMAFTAIDARGHRVEAARRAVAFAPGADVRLIGPLSKTSGVARAARLSATILAATGLSVVTTDFILDNSQPDEAAAAPDARANVAGRVDLVHLNADMLPLAAAYRGDVGRGAYTIGFFFWELDRPADCHRLGIDLVDEIWVASEYNRQCFAAWTDKPVTNVGTLLDLGAPPSRAAARRIVAERSGAGPRDFVFLATFDSLSYASRKNPLGLLRAFAEAFPADPDVRLIVKTHNALADDASLGGRLWGEVQRIAAGDRRIVLIDETLPFDTVLGLKAGSDCYVSLHRSEGFGFGLLEAMGLGVPVVCTAYSGNLDFCDAETAWLVEADDVGVAVQDYAYVSPGHRWAEPRHAGAVAALRAVRADAGPRAERAAAARARVTARYGIAAAAARYGDRLRAILATRPAVDAPSPASPEADVPPEAEVPPERRPRFLGRMRGA